MKTTLARTLFITLGVGLLAGCGSSGPKGTPKPSLLPYWLSPYIADIGQGNFVSESMVSQLKEGMPREQVRSILGTPLLVDPFRADRWDYVFDIRRGDGTMQRRRFTVVFVNDRLDHWGGDPLPKDGGEGVLPSRPAR
jgi:outer membrane protein assembly factor BamE